jgi:hypothetical protein
MVLSLPTGRKGFNLDNIVLHWIKAAEGAAMFSIIGTEGSFTLPNLLPQGAQVIFASLVICRPKLEN